MGPNRMSKLVIPLLVIITLGTFLSACSHHPALMDEPAQVVALPNNEVAGLTADDVVVIMLQAGFTDDEIILFGTDLRNKLATSGAARIHAEDKVQALFAVKGDYVHCSSRKRGSFIYDFKKKFFYQ